MKWEIKMNKKDFVILIIIVTFTILFSVIFIDFSIAPFEDAAILMRYSENFASNHGIVWNIGEKPVDGATDFLFMIIVGLLVKTGINVELASRVIGFTSHIITVCIIYIVPRKVFSAKLLPTFISSLFFAIGPGLYLVAAYFGTPFFVLFASLTWWMLLSIIKSGENKVKSILFAGFALITSLIRPEGVILTALMMLSIIYLNGFKKSSKTIVTYILTFIALGGMYFLWRWQYFGYPLPNPYYKKGAGVLHFDGLKLSIKNAIILCLPFIPVFIVGLYTNRTTKKLVAYLIPIVGFILSFVLVSSAMNFGRRFQYVILPLVLMSWWSLLDGLIKDIRFPTWENIGLRKKVTISILILTITCSSLFYQNYFSSKITYKHDGRYDVAIILSDFKDKDLTLATTEAGLLPLYSQWKSIDTWGLNDQWIAHNGGVSEEYLELYKPHVIVFHQPYYSGIPTGDWAKMIQILKNYAEENQYIQAAIFGDNPYDTHYYYVRSDFPESLEIVDRIRSIEYLWYGSGKKCINYAIVGLPDKK